MKTDIDIAREASLRPIVEIAEHLGLAADDLYRFGQHIAKVPLEVMGRYRDRPDGKLILVTAMTPTKHGEGKTTTTIGLTQALVRLGHRATLAIREPSLGPCMGLKGGGRRRRVFAGAAHGGDQSPFHRRPARRLRHPQSAGGGGGQPPAPAE